MSDKIDTNGSDLATQHETRRRGRRRAGLAVAGTIAVATAFGVDAARNDGSIEVPAPTFATANEALLALEAQAKNLNNNTAIPKNVEAEMEASLEAALPLFRTEITTGANHLRSFFDTSSMAGSKPRVFRVGDVPNKVSYYDADDEISIGPRRNGFTSSTLHVANTSEGTEIAYVKEETGFPGAETKNLSLEGDELTLTFDSDKDGDPTTPDARPAETVTFINGSFSGSKDVAPSFVETVDAMQEMNNLMADAVAAADAQQTP